MAMTGVRDDTNLALSPADPVPPRRFNSAAFLDGLTGAGLFQRLRLPGSPPFLYVTQSENATTESATPAGLQDSELRLAEMCRAVASEQTGVSDDTLGIYDRVAAKLRTSESPGSRQLFVLALLQRCSIFLRMGKIDDASLALDELRRIVEKPLNAEAKESSKSHASEKNLFEPTVASTGKR